MSSKDVNIGKNLRKVRIHSGMTQQELADRIGTTATVICSYEQNRSKPPFQTLIELARIFNVSTDYLLSFGDEFFDERFKTPSASEINDENKHPGQLSGRRMGIGRQIKELREERGLSKQELANGLSLSITTINKYERDMTAPSYGTLLEMARYFDVTTERLFGINTGRKLDISALPEDKKIMMRNLVGGMK